MIVGLSEEIEISYLSFLSFFFFFFLCVERGCMSVHGDVRPVHYHLQLSSTRSLLVSASIIVLLGQCYPSDWVVSSVYKHWKHGVGDGDNDVVGNKVEIDKWRTCVLPWPLLTCCKGGMQNGLFLSPTHFLITLSTLILSFQTFNSYLIYSFEISNNGWSRPCLDDPHFFINSFVLTFWITICGNDSFLKFCEILTV